MTHAGLPPQWTLEQARAYAREVEAVLQSDRYLWLLENMYGNGPDQWDPSLTGIERYRFIINAFTRMRFCYPDGRLDMDCKLAPEHSGEAGLIPWFQLERPQIDKKMIFGTGLP
ncbi:Bis(5'-nucleosyl)-tetraphosphatase [Photobacterium aphoticum]|uniref:Bis(5'-nucleosyl)-tetraphosphatase n=1 Tax=Photobacterium aphoticum TaxID=754436 RepID=A0A090QVQ3_9GAMM|nr:Bis(5'-nucleosyl)-tetraphosphatase [Photobacterium aphoticum]